MPDTLNKQAIINLLIDSPLREPIKINLIDIVNNTGEPDLPKVYSTITKELEIFQKATERRMKLADETIAKLGGATAPVEDTTAPTSTIPTPVAPMTPPPLDLPPLPQAPTPTPAPAAPVQPVVPPSLPTDGLSVPPLDLPPLPQMPMTPISDMSQVPASPSPVEPAVPTAPAFQPLGAAPMSSTSDEDALAEIQKELDSLKNEAAADVANAAAPAAAPVAPTTAPQA